MNQRHAKKLESQLSGQTVGGFLIHSLINHGKSAAVFKALKNNKPYAVKVFDEDIVEKFGGSIQAQRINREKSLIGKPHPNLIEIYGGGYARKRKLHFVVMEYLPWKNLAEVLINIPSGTERKIISQIAAAAQHLEGQGICHRDIKPENVAISDDFVRVKLLDLGVIKPQGSKTLTDGTGGKIFVGTLKYSPPEFLLGAQNDTPEDWRAITFYQLGGVLHDLIMRRPLFSDFETPYPRLVNAVQLEIPKIDSNSVSPSLVELANNCLIKNSKVRSQCVSWSDFKEEEPVEGTIPELKSRILKRTLSKTAPPLAVAGALSSTEKRQRLGDYLLDLMSLCRMECVQNRNFFPPLSIKETDADDERQGFLITFEPTKSLNLKNHLKIHGQINWVDSNSAVVEIFINATISYSAMSGQTNKVDHSDSIFKGVYVSDTVRRKLSKFLYAALDAAQLAQAGENLATSPLKMQKLNLEIAKDPDKSAV